MIWSISFSHCPKTHDFTPVCAQRAPYHLWLHCTPHIFKQRCFLFSTRHVSSLCLSAQRKLAPFHLWTHQHFLDGGVHSQDIKTQWHAGLCTELPFTSNSIITVRSQHKLSYHLSFYFMPVRKARSPLHACLRRESSLSLQYKKWWLS